MLRKLVFLMVALAVLTGCSLPVPASTQPPATPTATPPAGLLVIPDPSPTPLATARVSKNNGTCDNPYYPVVDGATWVYQMSTGDQATYAMSVGKNDTFTIDIQGQSSKFTIDGKCTRDGIVLMDRPGSLTTYTGDQGSSTVSTVNEQGVTLPNNPQIGDKWSQSIDVNTDNSPSHIQTEYQVLGFETITVPAGKFNALKLEQTGYLEIMGQKVAMHGFQWFAQGVGTVRSAMDSAPVIELVSYAIP
jgi:hypothetical protein